MNRTHTSRRRPPGRTTTASLLLALLALLTTVLGACTGGPEGNGQPTGAPSTPDPPGEIVMASGRDVTGKGGIRQQLIEEWNRQQQGKKSGYHARLVELPGTADRQRSQLLGALQSGSAEYDVVNLDVTWVPEFAEAGLVRDLPEKGLLDEDVIPAVAATARWDDKLYAVPFNSDVGLLYYRRDYLQAAGVTTTDVGTWPAVQGLITTLNDARTKLPAAYRKGWTTQLDPSYEGFTVNGIEAFASATDDFALTDNTGRYVGTVAQLEAGLTELRTRTHTSYTLGEATQSDEGDSLTDFAAGRTAFLRHWPYAYRTLHQSLPAEHLGVAPLPGKAVLGGQNLAVTKTSKRANAARDLIEFLTGQRSERCLLDAGFAATRQSAYELDSVTCPLKQPSTPTTPSAETTDRMPRDPAGRPAYARTTLLPALKTATHRPRTPLYGTFTQTFTAELSALFTPTPPSNTTLATSLHKSLSRSLRRP
ncbi:ABC transporter substrate-binding protein [Streptomyces venezuelae]|uniref:ABC transporter substrate-binding protein n=1 Tax=Streptomyces venezuelae TaxID=54571 RepID=A0A5P2D4I8_STRVZ|nr:extracellular solute-binding protein [Streptomyces venezuelae]QES48241.1 ABC transporter substrate-binding protein [Streptomyces venezuelae]